MANVIEIGMLLYPRLTQVDLTGPYEVLTRVSGARVHLLWKTLDPIEADSGRRAAGWILGGMSLDVAGPTAGPRSKRGNRSSGSGSQPHYRRRRYGGNRFWPDLGVSTWERAGSTADSVADRVQPHASSRRRLAGNSRTGAIEARTIELQFRSAAWGRQSCLQPAFKPASAGP
jgi:hypothetical protein